METTEQFLGWEYSNLTSIALDYSDVSITKKGLHFFCLLVLYKWCSIPNGVMELSYHR
jgi:hypothetical protein